MIIFKPNSFVYKPKAFWMLHLNDHFIYKTHVYFRTVNFSVASQSSHTYTFSRAFTVRILYNHKYQVFHPRGYLSFLVIITRHIFSFSCIQPCDSVERRSTVPSPPNQSPNAVLIITMYSHSFNAMSPCICNAMQICNAPLHVNMLYHATWTT